MKKGNQRVIKGWIFYDWANSVYNLVISSAIFPVFYANVTESHYLKTVGRDELLPNENVMVDFFGISLSNSVLFSYVLAASFLLVSILSPLLSGIADVTGSKKRFLQFFCYLGALSSISLFWFNPAQIELGMLSIFLASMGFWNSLVFYNAYLPEIAEPKYHDNISARGFSMGYFGSMILLVICLSIIMFIDPAYTKYSFILVGLWWMGFAQVTFRRLPYNIHKRDVKSGYIFKGVKELKNVFNEFRQTKRLQRYLLSFFFFNTGVQTVMLMAVVFAKKEIDWGAAGGDTGLIIAILLIQILGAGGAYLMSYISSLMGNLKTLIFVVMGWMALCTWAYWIETPTEFYFLAAGIGLVMGGVQALSRSTYSKFLPTTEDTTSYFSFYDVSEKLGIVLGLFFFGLMEYLTGDLRASVLSIITFFGVGLVLLIFVPRKESVKGRRALSASRLKKLRKKERGE
ncbi:MFS transporter [Brumimicrobium salinarum]|uniref:MFS transporter n=1 Tax=Brumimicrobium salinarum TaxID=2058658 RepID=A0A2I0R3L7_9FLAO|nr:MFS transporter [Brumimicrobium salinarum]PKR81173.1 MFS transporter [Brumimicrobium salinarum]